MSAKHRALVVEDDRETADELGETLTAIGFEFTTIDNKEQAAAAIQAAPGAFCLVLLDLQIKATPGSLRGHVENGKTLLRELRQVRPEHVGDGHWLPILVVSGYARETEEAVDAMKEGASDVIQKPFKSKDVSTRIRDALKRAGRLTHTTCHVAPMSNPSSAGKLVVTLSGERQKRRCRVVVNARAADLTEASFRLLLRLLVAHQSGKGVHKTELGATEDKGFKGISRLREELKPAVGTRVIVENDQHGTYRLVDEVVLDKCDVDAISRQGDSEIAGLASKLTVR